MPQSFTRYVSYSIHCIESLYLLIFWLYIAASDVNVSELSMTRSDAEWMPFLEQQWRISAACRHAVGSPLHCQDGWRAWCNEHPKNAIGLERNW